jgi:hypothetical protein
MTSTHDISIYNMSKIINDEEEPSGGGGQHGWVREWARKNQAGGARRVHYAPGSH